MRNYCLVISAEPSYPRSLALLEVRVGKPIQYKKPQMARNCLLLIDCPDTLDYGDREPKGR
jgi:hypothetical protein